MSQERGGGGARGGGERGGGEVLQESVASNISEGERGGSDAEAGGDPNFFYLAQAPRSGSDVAGMYLICHYTVPKLLR